MRAEVAEVAAARWPGLSVALFFRQSTAGRLDLLVAAPGQERLGLGACVHWGLVGQGRGEI